jgi:DNA-binding GntR family transcriptional regulator
VLVLRRTRTADDRIVARTTDVVAVSLLERRGLTDATAVGYVRGRRSVYEAMAGIGIQVRDGVAEIMPWKADKALADALDTKEGALLLRLDQTDFDLNGEAIINSTEYFVADAFKFQVYRKGTGARGSRSSSL